MQTFRVRGRKQPECLGPVSQARVRRSRGLKWWDDTETVHRMASIDLSGLRKWLKLLCKTWWGLALGERSAHEEQAGAP